MKTKKYLLAGVLILSLSTPAIAQDDSYKAALNPIISAMEAAPNDPEGRQGPYQGLQENVQEKRKGPYRFR